AAVFSDPVLHRLGIVGHQVCGPGGTRHFDAEGPALVEIGLMESEAGVGRHAYAVERHDAEQQGAGRIADTVDDHAFAAGANFGVFRLVVLDHAAVVASDAIIGAG